VWQFLAHSNHLLKKKADTPADKKDDKPVVATTTTTTATGSTSTTGTTTTSTTGGTGTAGPAKARKPKQPAKTTVSVVTQYKIDDATTVKGNLKTEYDRSGKGAHQYRLAVGVQQKISPNVTATIGSEINLNTNFSVGQAVGDPSSYGFQIQFK